MPRSTGSITLAMRYIPKSLGWVQSLVHASRLVPPVSEALFSLRPHLLLCRVRMVRTVRTVRTVCTAGRVGAVHAAGWLGVLVLQALCV